VIHPQASSASKTWPAERFFEIAAHLENAFDLEPVFIGAGEGLAAFRRWRTYSGAPLHEIKSLIAGAALFIGNDSGPAHVAAAFGIPVVVIFGASDPLVWAPWRTPSEVLAGTDGIAAISVLQVVEALERLGVRA
ncbi:MAG TPA: glycosyltransferase family 9 protein, partial [Bryobacteraceae bacterium]|nr:glycosyltransferase family 9 protein [Bryobacteraceae bacterium]